MQRLMAVARKEATQLRRDPRSLLLAFALPMALIVFFGYAISFDVRNIEMAILDRANSPVSRRLAQSFTSSGYFRVVAYPESDETLTHLLDDSHIRLALVIPPDFMQQLGSGAPAALQVIIDGSDANTATITQGYTDAILARFAQTVLGPDSFAPISVETRIWYNETLESVNMIVPGLIAVIMSIIAAMLTALTIAREWERGTMEQLAATPVARHEVILGKLLPYVGIGVIDVTLAVLAGVTIFDVPLRGSILLLATMTLLFLVGALGFGMFISATLKSQVLATQVAMISTYLPALLLSGFMFSIANMPLPLRIISNVVAAKYFIVVTRGVFLKGVGIGILWPQAVAMIVFAVAGVGLATRNFKKEIA
ncbi:MAG: ABC transporter permease [Gemmatimonadales bacterium]